MIHYLLHNWILPNSTKDEEQGRKWSKGQRNCANFLIGTFIYVIIYVILANILIRIKGPVDRQAMFTALFLIWLSDISVMAYEYKSYYGRLIIHEIDSGYGNQDDWVYDEGTHKYRLMNEAEKKVKKFQESERTRKVDEAIARKKRSREILQRKREIKAAKVIQRWWRTKLYDPPNGILYKRSAASFQDAVLNSTHEVNPND